MEIGIGETHTHTRGGENIEGEHGRLREAEGWGGLVFTTNPGGLRVLIASDELFVHMRDTQRE